jgi:membrane protein DedA with SNARE-associated domain
LTDAVKWAELKTNLTANLMETLHAYIVQYGYWAVFGTILAEDFGVPVPGETLLITGSLLASQGQMDIVHLLLAAWVGALAGDNIGYAIGRFGGRRLVLRFGHYAFINEQKLERTEAFFGKYGGAVVVLARFFEVLRQLNGIVAGIARMHWRRFLVYNALGAALWVCFWGMLFYELGGKALRLVHAFKRLELILIVVGALALAALIIYLLRRGR